MNCDKKIIYKGLAACLAAVALAWGCGDKADPGRDPVPAESPREPIVFSSPNPGPGTRAMADFPNSSIGVTATRPAAEPAWWSYEDINNERATIKADSIGKFWFRWDDTKYWPLDGSQLVFCAYSPYDGDSGGAVEFHYDPLSLELRLMEDMPDVLYAEGNTLLNSYSKTSKVAELGEFRHALSQLTVKVVADPAGFNPDVTIARLDITGRGAATLDLASDGDLTFPSATPFTYNPVSTTTPFASEDYSATVLLFPGTEDDTIITLTLNDSRYQFVTEYTLSGIMDSTTGQPLTLARAGQTEVIITVRSTPVENPNALVTLSGVLSDWRPMGDLGVTIN